MLRSCGTDGADYTACIYNDLVNYQAHIDG